jgi:hypothetical protein
MGSERSLKAEQGLLHGLLLRKMWCKEEEMEAVVEGEPRPSHLSRLLVYST